MLVPLTKGFGAIIDEGDWPLVEPHSWCALKGWQTWYAVTWIDRRCVLMHRLLLGAPKGLEVDHVDGDGLNNRRGNLRLVTKNQQQQNRPAQRRFKYSVFKGVHGGFWKNGHGNGVRWKWYAQIRVGGRNLRRYCASELDAARTYDAMARQHFGEFAKVNFEQKR